MSKIENDFSLPLPQASTDTIMVYKLVFQEQFSDMHILLKTLSNGLWLILPVVSKNL